MHTEKCAIVLYSLQHRFGISICLADLLLNMRTVVHLLLRIMVCMIVCMAVTTSCQYILVNSENAERAVAHVRSNRVCCIIYARPSPVVWRSHTHERGSGCKPMIGFVPLQDNYAFCNLIGAARYLAAPIRLQNA